MSEVVEVEVVKGQMVEAGLEAFVGLSMSVSHPTSHSSRPRNTDQYLSRLAAVVLPQERLYLCRV
jgi:hypothetical protein